MGKRKSKMQNDNQAAPKGGQISTNTDSSSLASNNGYSNRGGSSDNAVKGAMRGHGHRGGDRSGTDN